jgi:hypothetical protein
MAPSIVATSPKTANRGMSGDYLIHHLALRAGSVALGWSNPIPDRPGMTEVSRLPRHLFTELDLPAHDAGNSAFLRRLHQAEVHIDAQSRVEEGLDRRSKVRCA